MEYPAIRLGKHLILDISNVRNIQSLTTVDAVCAALDRVVAECKLTVVGRTAHQFEPQGATVVYLLSESHLSIHTWPERGAACVDLFCCAQRLWVDEAMRAFRAAFPGATMRSHIIPRQG